jgi:flagellar hook-associated protein 2
VTLTLKEESATAVVVEVTRDATAAKAKISSFVEAYNSIVAFFAEQSTAAIAGKASIGRDPILRGFKNGMRQALQDIYPDSATFSRLATVGLGFDSGGKLTLDTKAFDNAIAANPTAVQNLMAGADGDGGAFQAISTLIDSYTVAGGLIADVRERITEQVKVMNNRLDQMEQRLSIRRATLQREFTAADRAMTQLNSQGNSLGSLANQYRLF